MVAALMHGKCMMVQLPLKAAHMYAPSCSLLGQVEPPSRFHPLRLTLFIHRSYLTVGPNEHNCSTYTSGTIT